MASDHRDPLALGPLRTPGRRDAVRAVAGIGTVMLGLSGRSHATSAPAEDEMDAPAGPGLLQVAADSKKRRRKRGRTGPTGPTGPVGPTGPTLSISQNEASQPIPDGGNAHAQAACPPGSIATGGGASISTISCQLVSSNVQGSASWSATGRCPSGSSATLVVRVICLG
jgi:hypothetical protein